MVLLIIVIVIALMRISVLNGVLGLFSDLAKASEQAKNTNSWAPIMVFLIPVLCSIWFGFWLWNKF